MATQTVPPVREQSSREQIGCYAVKVRSRSEDVVAKSLREKGHRVLAPSYTASRRYSDRVKKISCALFPGYVFVHMDLNKLISVVSTNGVSYIVRSGRGHEPLSPQETSTVEALCRAQAPCEPCEYLQVGQRVIIEEGPFAGLTGVLQRVRDENRVIVSVESLHRSVSLAIGRSSLRVIEPEAELLSS